MSKAGGQTNNALINFLKACYEADNREQAIPNFFSAKIEHGLLLENADILEGELNNLPLENTYGQNIYNTIAAHRFEKSVYVACFFLTGTSPNDSKTLYAPLLLIPATVDFSHDCYNLRIENENVSINPAFFKALNAIDENDTSTINEILEIIAGTHINFLKIAAIERLINERYTEIDTSDLLLFPKLATLKELKKEKDLKIVSAAGICVIRKSQNMVHVTKELEELVSEPNLSLPLFEFLNYRNGNKEKAENVGIQIPATLNASQLSAIANASRYSTSIIIGPTGTGKSYTIAAMAINAAMNGQSVLITSAKNQAVDVVQNKIESTFGVKDICIRAGGKGDYKDQLKTQIENLLSGISLHHIQEKQITNVKTELEKIINQIDKLEKLYQTQSKKALAQGKILAKSRCKIIGFITKFWVKNTLPKSSPVWKIIAQLENLYPQKYALLKELIALHYKNAVSGTVRRNRKMVKLFATALSARTIQTKEERFDKIDFEKLKTAFPVWLVNLSEAAKVLPLKVNFFDLVIIDEASQCDITTALPLLHRAKKAVICGDPKQLRHVSFLSQQKMLRLANQFGLNEPSIEKYNYRNNSLLDVSIENIANQDAVSFLNEHFRSQPEIISYSNKNFYNGNLRVMTENPFLNQNGALRFLKTQGKQLAGINKQEAQIILNHILEIIEEDQGLAADTKRSIGVLSPFREQINFLNAFLREHIPSEEFVLHSLLIGTAHSFQGEERDVMFISFSIDNHSHPTTLRHLNKADVFNVSITRARVQQYIVYSRDAHLFEANSNMTNYLGQNLHNNSSKSKNTIYDKFSTEVVESLTEMGFANFYINNSVAGVSFDIIVKNGQKLIGIDLIGFSDQYAEILELERIKIFKRTGHYVFPIPYNHWLLNKEMLLNDLKNVLLE